MNTNSLKYVCKGLIDKMIYISSGYNLVQSGNNSFYSGFNVTLLFNTLWLR